MEYYQEISRENFQQCGEIKNSRNFEFYGEVNYEKNKGKDEKDDFNNRFGEIQHYVEKSLLNMAYSEINIYYNHYFSSTTFAFKKVTAFPIEFKGKYYEN